MTFHAENELALQEIKVRPLNSVRLMTKRPFNKDKNKEIKKWDNSATHLYCTLCTDRFYWSWVTVLFYDTILFILFLKYE